jgi:hypothetical protein
MREVYLGKECEERGKCGEIWKKRKLKKKGKVGLWRKKEERERQLLFIDTKFSWPAKFAAIAHFFKAISVIFETDTLHRLLEW